MKTLVILGALLGLAANSQLEPTSKVWVQGSSTVRGFTCNAAEFTSRVATTGSAEIATMVDGGVVTIPVAKLDCGNGTMNGHMRKALKAQQNTDIEFALASYTVENGKAVLNGTLSMAGASRPISIPATIETQAGIVRVKASTQLNMSEWGIKPPSLMMGTMKVKDAVTVGFDVTLKP